MIHPKEMAKVSIVGPKSRMEAVIEALHELGVLHVEDYQEELEGVDIGEPSEEAEELSDRLVRIRSVKSRLPEDGEVEGAGNGLDVEEIGERVEEIEEELGRVESEKEEEKRLLERLEMVHGLGLDLDDFQDYRSLEIYLGTVDDRSFEGELEDGRYELFTAGDTIALFVDSEEDGVEAALRNSGFDSVPVQELVDMEGEVGERVEELEEDIDGLEKEREELRQELEELGSRWRSGLEQLEHELSGELEKAEAPLNFATTESAFIAEGWIPEEDYGDAVKEVEDAAGGSVYIERLEEEEGAPVAHDNPQSVRPLESLIKLYGTPSYHEVDPTFLLLTFPVLFGFMLGDIGYGITTFAVFYAFYRKYPEAEGLWYSLMYASVATVAFGLVYGEMFGYIIFGHHSELAAFTGIHAFEKIPVLFHRVDHLGTVLKLSVLIGVVHVNAGLLIGAYNEYVHHGIREAVLAKFSWIVLEIGAVVWFLTGSAYIGGGVLLAGVLMLALGEGIEGVVEIPSLLSNILSYLRIFGVVMAVVALAATVNTLAEPLFHSGSAVMVGLGVGVLVVGHAFNTFLKMMECGLQGIRLHYVEFFTKFFEGGGEYYKPFGRRYRAR